MRTKTVAIAIFALAFGVPFLVAAQTTPPNPGNTTPTNPGPNVQLINPLSGVDCSSGNGNCVVAFLTNILKFVIQIGTVVIILMIVYVGFMFVTAQGNETKLTRAKDALLWTVVGALILLGAQAIALGIESTVKALGG